MALTLKIKGSKKAQANLQKSARLIQPRLQKNIRLAGEIVIGEARKQFQGSRTRAMYSISGGKRKLRPKGKRRPVTAPNHKLAVFEGTYRKSISQDVKATGTKRKRTFMTEIGPTVVYAAAHEFGHGHLPQRQVLTPAIENTKNQVFKLLGKTLKVVKI